MRRKTCFGVTFILALALMLTAPASSAWAQTAQVPLPGSSIPQFMDPLPTLTAGGGTMETVTGPSSDAAAPTTLYMKEFMAQVLPLATVPGYAGTSVFGYRLNSGTATADTYIGPVFVASRGTPAAVKYVNNLGSTDTTNVGVWKFSFDQTLHWANPANLDMVTDMAARMLPYAGPIPAVPHLHGGEVPAAIDGGPDAWFLSNAGFPTVPTGWSQHGKGFYSFDDGVPATNYSIYRYPNTQEAGPLWFHDHLLGGTRVNVYAGLAGAYLLTDPGLTLPTGMTATGLANGPATEGGNELTIPLVLQDRMFDTSGQLYFPDIGLNPEHPFWIPEFVGDTIVVNGKSWPFLNVEAKRYRFLMINGSNARFYELNIKAPMYVIGTDGGFLDAPVQVSKLVMGPGERYQVIIDFGKYAGKTLVMTNTGRTPFPKGTPPQGSTLGRIVQFRVGPVTSFTGPDPSYDPATLVPIRTGTQTIQRLVNPATGTLNVTPAQTRQLTLNEVMGPGGPLEILVNNTKWSGTRPTSATTHEPIPGFSSDGTGNYLSELPAEGTTEVWEIINITADAHPIHLHLVQFQILNRQNFNVNNYLKAYNAAFMGGYDLVTGATLPAGVFVPAYGPPSDYFTANADGALGGNPAVGQFLQNKPVPPDPNEAGWKDTAIMYPGQVTRIAVRFMPTDTAVGATAYYPFNPNDPNPAADSTAARPNYNYVWHCHIVDHEDNEMMRPYQVTPAAAATRTYVMGTDY
jgi:spore coat protein A